MYALSVSGAGGAVVAKELAEAGLSVIILEAGEHHDSSTFGTYEPEMLRRLFWGQWFTEYTRRCDRRLTRQRGRRFNGAQPLLCSSPTTSSFTQMGGSRVMVPL